jgi:flagellar hook assembly protein FlgD
VVLGDGDQPDGKLRLEAARPNPFVSTTLLRFALPTAGAVRIAVYDIRGRRVAELVDREFGAGDHTVVWDGTDSRGEALAAGLYFVMLDGGDRRAVSKVVRLH